MWSLYQKEIVSFFSNITGYLVIIVFLFINSLLLWIIPGDYNILDMGYARLNSFFEISPWVFLFLVSAVTMRSFAEEKKMGTLELLFTRPITELQLVIAKYLAAISLVVLSLIPSLIFYASVYYLANPTGNMDTGGTWGSYLGLFFLAGIYVAIGIFASSLTDNQIIAFIISSLMGVIMFKGFDVIAALPVCTGYEHIILYLGINEHYLSISRGVIDSRDIVYFISITIIFIIITRKKLENRN